MRLLLLLLTLCLGFGKCTPSSDFAAGGDPFAARGELWAIDLASGDRTRVHILFVENLLVVDMAFDPDAAHLYFVTSSRLVRLDTRSGNEVTISDSSTGAGPALKNVGSIAIDPANDRAFVVNRNPNAVIQVDLASGARTLISDASRGTGPTIGSLTQLDYDPLAARLVAVTNARLGPGDAAGAVLRFDLATGDRTLVSGPGTGLGPPLEFANHLQVVADHVGDRVFAHSTAALWEVDLTSGDRRLIHAVDSVETHPFSQRSPIAFDPSAALMYEINGSGLREIDPATSAAELISGPGRAPVISWIDIALDRAGNRVLAVGVVRTD